MIARATAATLATVVAIAIGGVVVTTAQQAPEQVRAPGMGRTIPGDLGIIEGKVVEAGTGRPVAGARVDVRGPDQTYVTTDQSGRYETRPLTPGAFAISVTAPDYATAFYDGGAGSPSGQSSTTVDIGPGSVLSNIDVVMQATGRLSGRVLDDRGRGLGGAYIQLTATSAIAAGPVPRVAYARSESDGSYRVTAAPGDYTVRAYVDKQVRPSRDAALAYVETFFPGVRAQDEAQVIRLDAGVEQYDVDVALLSSRTVRLSGTVVDPAGTDLEDVTVSLRPRLAGGNASVELQLNARGEFDARDVVPGLYFVNVTDPRRPARWKAAREPLEILEDTTGVEIRASGAASIAGRIVKDPRSAGQLNLAQTVISFVSGGGNPGMSSSISTFDTEADGSFHDDVPAGRLTLMVMGPREWTPRAVRLDGVDVFGFPLELTPGAHEIEVVVTDHTGSASGLVVDRRGAPLGGFDVVLFPQDEARWYFASPFIRQTRSSQNGRFELPLLPPGDYLAVATEGVPFLMIGDPVPTLRRLQSVGTRLTVGDGDQKTLSLRASPAP